MVEDVLVLIREKRDYSPRLQDLVNRYWQELGKNAWEYVPKEFDGGDWNIRLNRESYRFENMLLTYGI